MRKLQTIPQTGQRTVAAAIYLRVSTVDQGRRGFSIPEQRKACLEKAQALARVAEAECGEPVSLETFEFIDTAGGDLIERPELERARRFVRESRPTWFICLDPDRFSRAVGQAILVADEIEGAGTKLEFVQHDYQTTSEGRLFFTLRLAIAEYEKAKILERTARGKRGKLAAGGIPHRVDVYGYDFVPEAERRVRARSGEAVGGALVPNPAEAAWVRQMFEWVVSEHLGSQGVAERLNEMAVPTKRGGTWRRGVVARILRNTVYIGQLQLNRYDFTGLGGQAQLPKERRTKAMTPKLRPATEWVMVQVPAIVSEDLFARAQAVLRDMKRRSGTRIHPGRRGHLLSGVVTCGLCGAPMHYAWNNKLDTYLLRCANKYPLVRGLRTLPPTCPHPYQRADRIERQAWDQVRAWLLEPELLQADLERLRNAPEPGRAEGEEKEQRLAVQLADAKAQQARILYLAGKGVVHPEVAEEQLAAVKRHLDALEREIEAVRRVRRRDDVTAAGIQHIVAVARDLHARMVDNLDALTLAERQAVLRMLVREVRVFPRGVVEVYPVDA